MVAFRIAYRLAHDSEGLVIPALLEPIQPEHHFKSDGAIAFQFNFKGFLPRHVLPALIVDNHQDIARIGGREIVWQNGVLLRSLRDLDAEALVRADYHERNIDIRVKGSDALAYLGLIRHSILNMLLCMRDLPFEERVQLRPDMRKGGSAAARFGDDPVWISYNIIRSAQANRMPVAGPDGHLYELDKVLAVTPVPPELRRADVFISYASEDRPVVEGLKNRLEGVGFSVWFDGNLMGAEPFRQVIDQRLAAAKAVVVFWTPKSINSRYVRYEADTASESNKLICLRDSQVEMKEVPGPFRTNDHILDSLDFEGLLSRPQASGCSSGEMMRRIGRPFCMCWFLC
jgi:hypothetical protein